MKCEIDILDLMDLRNALFDACNNLKNKKIEFNLDDNSAHAKMIARYEKLIETTDLNNIKIIHSK